jgi:hypothetical protein
MNLFRQPLFRLLAVNLAIGASVALLMVGGLVALNPAGLRDLVLADRSPATALGLLLFGFVITFGSAAMGSAIMTLARSGGRGGKTAPVARMERSEIRGRPPRITLRSMRATPPAVISAVTTRRCA